MKKEANKKTQPGSASSPESAPKYQSPKDRGFPIVGIGASAGGLRAFSQVLRNLPVDTGMAFVLVQHLDPKHASILPELMTKETKMPVSEIKNGMAVEPNHVYVMPPNVYIAILHGVLNLMPRTETARGIHMPIDYFFRSLAEDQESRAIGVVLSGTATDGTHGLREIKARGGITFAQNPETAEYDGMPQSAISAGVVDFALPPEEIAKELARIGRHPYLTHPKAVDTGRIIPETEVDLLNKIYIILRGTTGVDFTYYKPTTVKRRIARRMLLNKIDKLDEYVNYLQANPDELGELYQDILINVTEFFRDHGSFDTLKTEVFPNITKDRTADTPIRIWVPGCSTGEEVYSIAITLLEFLDNVPIKPAIQIFATDINERVLSQARTGIYPESITNDVSPERLRRFFSKVTDGYQVNKSIREMCIFAKHNITKDPPFSRLDFISFRNVLIYMGSVLQKKVVPVLHYALNPNGFLMLGTAETVGEFSMLFSLVDKKHKIYARRPVPSKLPIEFAVAGYPLEQLEIEGRTSVPAEKRLPEFNVMEVANHVVLDRFAPPGVVINDKLDVVQFRGHTSPYLEHASGAASLNLLSMAREGLALDLRTLIHKAKTTNAIVAKEGLKVLYNGSYKYVDLEVIPIKSPAEEFYYLVLFEDVTAEKEKKEAPGKEEAAKEKPAEGEECARLKRELGSTKDYLQSVIEEKDAANEELRAANEEIQSSNEELQSINEELETAKEELQSTNEELTTVNEELQNRNFELSQVNDDLNNVLSSVSIPIVILGRDLRIRRFTPAAQRLLNVIPADIGRSIINIQPNIELPDLEHTVLDVIESLNVKTEEVLDRSGRWYSMHIRPYRTAENKIDGAVVAFLDINDLKSSMERLRESSEFGESLNMINALINSTLETGDIIQEVLANAAGVLDVESAMLFIKEDSGWVARYAYRMPGDIIGKRFTLEQARHTDISFKTGKPLVINNTEGDGRIDQAFAREYHIRSLLDVALTAKGRPFGDLAFHYHSHPVEFTDAQIDFANKLATSMALALENSRLYTEQKRAAEFSGALNEVNAAISSTLEFNEIMKRVIVEATRALEAEAATVNLREQNRWTTKYVYGLPGELIGSKLTDEDVPHAVLAMRTDTPATISDAYNDERVNREAMKRNGIRSTLAIPLRVREDFIGVLLFNYFSHAVTFNDVQLDFAKKLSTAMSLALENARLYSTERHIANTLQDALLIMPEKVRGVDFGYLYRSATETARVGGDFYDIFELEHGKVGIVVGDVSGKGIEATSLTAVVKDTFKAHAYEGLSPADIMSRTNELVKKVNAPGNFVTTFLGVLDTKTGELFYCSAGHPPTIIKKKKGSSSLSKT